MPCRSGRNGCQGRGTRYGAIGTDQKLVRYHQGKQTYEVIVREGLVRKYREGEASLADVLVSLQVFHDARRMTKVNVTNLVEAFQVDDMNGVLDTILKKGVMQQGEKERKEDTQRLRNAVIQKIHDDYFSPNGCKVPLTRIENALKKANVKIDGKKSADGQVDGVVRSMKEVLDLRRTGMETRAIVTVEKGCAKQALKILIKLGKVDSSYCTTKSKSNCLRGAGVVYKVTVRKLEDLKSSLEAGMESPFEVEVIC